MRNEETSSEHGMLKFLIGVVIGLGLGYWIGYMGYIRLEKSITASEEPQSVAQTSAPIKGLSVSTPVKPITASTPVKSTPKPAQQKPASKASSTDTSTEPNALSLVSYSHDWYDSDAQISFKNNTNKVITSFTGRMIYYDMSGNMLDYQDFTKKVTIDPGMTKRVELRGYNTGENYAYYKNKASYSQPQNKYKIKFELKSFQYKQ